MHRMKRWIKEWVPTLAIAVIVSFTFNTYVAQGMKVPTGSMLPTIQLDDKILVEKMVKLTDFKFGDVVVFYPPLPDQADQRFVKRLIGLPGDTIEVKDGALYRNGEKVDEPYLKEKMNYTYGPITVPADQYFFLGDNRNDSLDSHLWPTPFVDKSKLIGKVLFRYYPFNHIGALDAQ
ncbi:signal peptidase I [Paenibacillus doosanensis]|uniref:Signal peptidase I n=1 Tax=Paenibacillus konkukensis TaxID=2020716 RepID=A0ABY4RVZ4_9BACL|nr:signal peptidase I [Paenibacillus doosanensis]MCS7460758.1 signal peptidase I [Paenibacillus doosanensis]UQZ85939.1 Signal peptidase I S [Paenibacillus konkukensis]